MGAPAQEVVINGRAAVRAEIGGVERFARELALWLPALRPDRYRVLAPAPALAHRSGHLWEQVVLPLLAMRAALILAPANLAPTLSSRTVVVVHDAAALRHPEAYAPSYVAYHRRLLLALSRRARLLVTVSEFSRTELADVLGIAPDRIAVVPGGVGEEFGPDVDPEPVRAAHALARPYVLSVATPSARKNLRALEPVAQVLAEHGLEVVVAGSDRGYLRGAARDRGYLRGAAPPGVRRLGYVDEHELPGLYAGARAFVTTSEYEGFGLPCLEAMASGVPVVASRRGALPETVGDAGVLADPADTDGFTACVLGAALDEALRHRLINRGLARAASFSWRRSAAAIDAVVDSLLAAA